MADDPSAALHALEQQLRELAVELAGDPPPAPVPATSVTPPAGDGHPPPASPRFARAQAPAPAPPPGPLPLTLVPPRQPPSLRAPAARGEVLDLAARVALVAMAAGAVEPAPPRSAPAPAPDAPAPERTPAPQLEGGPATTGATEPGTGSATAVGPGTDAATAVDAGPFTEVDAVLRFRDGVAALPGVRGAYLRRVREGRAVIEVELD